MDQETDRPPQMETKRVKLWLYADVIEWFKAQQGGERGYQTAINAALRKLVEDEMPKVG
jgi:uncharacterized protein (DUF4415 family)